LSKDLSSPKGSLSISMTSPLTKKAMEEGEEKPMVEEPEKELAQTSQKLSNRDEKVTEGEPWQMDKNNVLFQAFTTKFKRLAKAT
jgi:hypothetical protein